MGEQRHIKKNVQKYCSHSTRCPFTVNTPFYDTITKPDFDIGNWNFTSLALGIHNNTLAFMEEALLEVYSVHESKR